MIAALHIPLAAAAYGFGEEWKHPAAWLTLAWVVVMVFGFDRLRWWSAKRRGMTDEQKQAPARGEARGMSQNAAMLVIFVMLTITFGIFFTLNAVLGPSF